MQIVTYTTVSMVNSCGCYLDTEYCKDKDEILKAVNKFVDIIEQGDSIVFDVIERME